MGDVVNLNQYRKKAQRAEKEQRAALGRARSGRTKAERVTTRGDSDRRGATLDGKRLETDGSTERPDDDPERA